VCVRVCVCVHVCVCMCVCARERGITSGCCQVQVSRSRITNVVGSVQLPNANESLGLRKEYACVGRGRRVGGGLQGSVYRQRMLLKRERERE